VVKNRNAAPAMIRLLTEPL